MQTLPPPFTSRPLTLSAIFELGLLRPASVQRGFEWTPAEADTLLADLDAAFTAHQPTDVDGDAGASQPVEPRPGAGVKAAAEPVPDAPVTANDAAPPDAEADPADDLEAHGARSAAEPPAATPEPALGAAFLGTVVLRPRACDGAPQNGGASDWEDGRATDGLETVEVFDGLQRLTTLTILFCVLRDLHPNASVSDRLAVAVGAPGAFRLALPGPDPTLVRDAQEPGAVFRITHERLTASRAVGKRIQAVKNAYRARLALWSAARRDAFAAFTLDRTWLNVVSPEDPRLAREIFITTNLHGKRLKPLAILKGQISDLAEDDRQADAIAALWDEIAADLGGAFGDFLRAVDMIERETLQGAQWPTDLGAHLTRRLAPGAGLAWMRGLAAYAQSWAEMTKILDQAGEGAAARHLWRLGAFHWPEWRPLALFYWRRRAELLADGARADIYVKRFDRLHRRAMALSLVDSVGARREAFRRALTQAKRGVDPTRAADRRRGERENGALTVKPMQRAKIDRALRSQIKNGDLRSPLAKWLEMSQWRPEAPMLMRASTVEHILPQHPPEHSPELRRFSSQEEYDRCCYALGNLAVLPAADNRLVSNKDFPEKRAALTANAERYWLLRDVVAEPEWGAAQIDARSIRLRAKVWSELRLKPPKRFMA